MSSLTAVQRAWDRITNASPMRLLTKPQATRLVRASIARFDADQARVPAGFEGGGRFRSLADRLTALLQDWVKGEGPDDPLDEFNREQLRKTAKGLADKAKAAGDHDRAARLTPRRGASSDEIKLALYKDMRSRRDAPAGKPEGPKVTPRKATAPTAPKSDLPDDPEALRDALDLHKVPELKDMLREQGLPVSGRKRELVDRLVEHQATGGRAPAKATKPNPERPGAGGDRLSGAAALGAVPARSRLTTGGRDAPVQFTPAERRAVDAYGSDGQEINVRLRSDEPLDARTGRVVASLDSAVGRSRTTADIEVWRGSQSGQEEFGDRLSGDLTGAEFTDRAYLSTSVDDGIALDFARIGPVPLVMRVHAPAGTGALALSDPPNARHRLADGTSIHMLGEGQGEILLERGLRMRVTRDHGTVDGVRRVDVEVVPTAKPDPEQKVRADVADQVQHFARLIRDGQDPHDRETTPKLDRIAAGLTGGSLSNADASDQLAALADEYAGSASGDNLRNWSRALANPEQKARFRQAEIDKVRGVAEVAAEVHELIGNETDPDATRRSLRAIGQRHGVDTAHLQDLAGDPTALREAADELAKAAKLTRIGSVAEPASFDRKQHEGIAGPLRDGQSVEVVRPGYSARLADGEQVQISKARVEAKAPAKAAPAKVTPARPPGAVYELPAGISQSDYQALVTAKSRPPYDVTGMTGADDLALVERASNEANAQRILRQYQDLHERQLGRMTTAQVQADLTRRAREAFAGRQVATNLDMGSLREVLRDRRFKTQFETGRSGGVFQPEERAFRESSWFGLPVDTPVEQRPIYGYLVTGGSGKKLVDTYGDAQVILRPEVRSRTTAMVGDSMENILAGRPAPVDDPDWHAFTPNPDMDAVSRLERNYDGPAFNRDAYIEAQVHGGVTVDDIAEVVLSVRPDEETRRLLEEAGIKWRVKR